jgi:DNA polymerase III epsilon subunit-like protein
MTYVVIDFETTGLDYRKESVIEIAAVKLDENFKEIGSFQTMVNLIRRPLPEFITKLTGIKKEDLNHGMGEREAFGLLEKFIGHATVVAQYAPFDLAFLFNYGIEPRKFICTKSLTAQAEPNESSSLGPTCERLGIELANAHRALDDARATAKVLEYRIKQGGLKVENTLVVTEGRPLNFIPLFTNYIYTKTGALIADFDMKKEETE